METGQEYIGSKDPHPNFSEVLRSKVFNGKIGQWTKIKGKIYYD
jgi:hypothetical protein